MNPGDVVYLGDVLTETLGTLGREQDTDGSGEFTKP
jgi:hypothetical protein